MNTEQDLVKFVCSECGRKTGQIRRETDCGIICLDCKHIDFGTIHGHKVVAAEYQPGGRGTRPGRVILVDRGAGYHGERWVTAWHGRGLNEKDPLEWDGEWGWGHYFSNEAKARTDYADRCGRGY